MIGLVLHALWVSILLGFAAALAEPLARALRLPTRAVWGAALLGSVALVGWGSVSSSPVTEASTAEVLLGGDATAADMPAPGHRGEERWWGRLSPLPALTLAAVHARIPAPPAALRERGEHLFALVWAMWSVSLVGFLVGGALHHRRARRRRPREDVLGHSVRIVPAGGPAVAGFLHPEILLPCWALELPDTELRLLLRHEEEHRRARDPLLLGGASLLVALAPWNPVLWWQLRRLRDALEIDCDTRVLDRTRRSAGELRDLSQARTYAELLLRVGSLTSAGARTPTWNPAAFVTPAIGGSQSQLERRIRAMRPIRPHALPLAAAFGAVVLLATAACVADRPTPVEPVNQAASENRSILPVDERVAFTGPVTDASEASTPADEGDTPQGERRVPFLRSQVDDVTPDADTSEFHAISGASGESIVFERSPLTRSDDDPAPLFVADGVILNARSFADVRIPAGDIVSLEVTKGEAALALYGPRAAGGVVTILTRAGEEHRARNPPPAPPGGR